MTPISTLALIWLQDTAAQAGTAQAVPTSATPIDHFFGGNSALLDMLQNSGLVAKGVLLILLLASLYSWGIILGKWTGLKKARRQSEKFLRAFRKASRLEEIAAVSEQFKPSPLVQVFDDTYAEYRRQMMTLGEIRSYTPLERAAQNASSESLTVLERRMTWLATIGAIAPFIGLFGTIMGIVDAFHGLGTDGGATLRAVAPGISEALITTAAGLAVAIPAVIGYNQFTARLREMGARLDGFSRELLTSIEEIPAPGKSTDDFGRQREVPRGLHR